jgi:peptide chain release factor 3
MLLDNRRGVEEQTRKLFNVCKLRRTPVFTLVNKCDRPGEDPFQLLDDVEADLGVACYPVTWPIFRDHRFVGVYDRFHARVLAFTRGEDHGQSQVATAAGALDDPAIVAAVGDEALARLGDDIALLDAAGAAFDEDAVREGTLSPTFFASALTNFGVEPFFRAFLDLAPPPVPRPTSEGLLEPTDPRFTGFVFKIQANLDPKHRDRIAFVRVCSGRFVAGMSVTNQRSGKEVRLAQPQTFMARERTAVDEAWPGDVVGIHDRGGLRIGDSLVEGGGTLEFSDIPRFSPEHFAKVSVPDPLRRKHLDTGLRQLSEEGAAQVFYAESIAGPAPLVGAVGPLQFDVLLHRLEHEYGVEARLERLPYVAARWVTGPEAEVDRVATGYDRTRVEDARGRPLLLFQSPWSLQKAEEKERGGPVAFHAVAP